MLENKSQVILAANMSVDINRRASRIVELFRKHCNGVHDITIPTGDIAVFVGTIEKNPQGTDAERVHVHIADTYKFRGIYGD
jgi:hypothetical protein